MQDCFLSALNSYWTAWQCVLYLYSGWVWLNGHRNQSNEDFMLQHPGGDGGEATQFLQCTTFALEVLLYNASAADPQLWFINLCYQLYPCSPHMCMDKWPGDTVDHPSILVCLLDRRIGIRECENINFDSFFGPHSSYLVPYRRYWNAS